MKSKRGGINHPKFQDLKGRFNGELEIIKYVNIPKDNGNSNWLWECKCSCKEIIYVRTARLNGTESTQERCKKCQEKVNGKNRILPDYLQIRNFLYSSYKNKAKSRNYEFDLEFNEFDELLQKNCYYCGQEPEEHKGDLIRLRESIPFKRNGIDRKDSNIGYTLINVVPCCTMCNFAKLNYSIKELSTWLNRIHNYNNKELW